MKREVKILLDIPDEKYNYDSYFEAFFDVASDLGEVINIQIHRPPNDHRVITQEKVLKAVGLKGARGRWRYMTMDQIRLRLGPRAVDVKEYLDFLTAKGKLVTRVNKEGKQGWKLK